jgi:hypothetical protein
VIAAAATVTKPRPLTGFHPQAFRGRSLETGVGFFCGGDATVARRQGPQAARLLRQSV